MNRECTPMHANNQALISDLFASIREYSRLMITACSAARPTFQLPSFPTSLCYKNELRQFIVHKMVFRNIFPGSLTPPVSTIHNSHLTPLLSARPLQYSIFGCRPPLPAHQAPRTKHQAPLHLPLSAARLPSPVSRLPSPVSRLPSPVLRLPSAFRFYISAF